MMRDFIRSLPVRSAFGLPIYVADSLAATFSTTPRVVKAGKFVVKITVLFFPSHIRTAEAGALTLENARKSGTVEGR